MVVYVKLSKLTWAMEEAHLGRWLKKEGDSVSIGDPLCEIETEKSVDKFESTASGILGKIVFPEGSNVLVGQVMAVIISPGEQLPDENELNSLNSSANSVDSTTELTESIEQEHVSDIRVKTDRIMISPLARNLAQKHGLDLSSIIGTGPNGRIVKDDIELALSKVENSDSTSSESDVIPLSDMRQIIADRLSHSVKTAVHVPMSIDVDMSLSSILHKDLKEQHPHVSYTDIIIKAVSSALQNFPHINSITIENGFKPIKDINIGFAVNVKNGLVVPVIHNSERKTIPEISLERVNLINKSHSDSLVISDTSYATFTVSNLGSYGVDFFAPIIDPPQVAIIGIGKISKKPVVIDDNIGIRPLMTITLVFDHRIIDGANAADFLKCIKDNLESPNSLS